MLSKSPAHFWFGVCEASLSVQRAWAAAVGSVWMDGRGFYRQTRLCLTASTHPVSSVHLLYYTLSQAELCSAARWHRDAAHTSTQWTRALVKAGVLQSTFVIGVACRVETAHHCAAPEEELRFWGTYNHKIAFVFHKCSYFTKLCIPHN